MKSYNKLDAQEKLAKHIGFYEKRAGNSLNQNAMIIIPDDGRDNLAGC